MCRYIPEVEVSAEPIAFSNIVIWAMVLTVGPYIIFVVNKVAYSRQSQFGTLGGYKRYVNIHM